MNDPSQSNQPKKKVLLAEGYAATIAMTEETLKSLGYDVVSVSSYADAVRELEAGAFDAIVTSGKLADGPHTDVDGGHRLLKTAAERFPGVKRVLHSGTRPPEGSLAQGFVMKAGGSKDLAAILSAALKQ